MFRVGRRTSCAFRSCIGGEDIDADGFQEAADFNGDTPAGPGSVSDDPLERLGLESHEVRCEFFPQFIRLEVIGNLGVSEAGSAMQDLKAREVEHARLLENFRF